MNIFTRNKIIIGVVVVAILAIALSIIYLPRNTKSGNNKTGTGVTTPSPVNQFPKALQDLINNKIAQSPQARFVFLVESNELSITYTPGTKAFVVVAHKAATKEAIYKGADKWFANLGVTDISKLTIYRRLDPQP